MNPKRMTFRNVDPDVVARARKVSRWSGWSMGAILNAALIDYLSDIDMGQQQ
jgi:hypothetical protein